MFADAATYNKSGYRSMWAIFSAIIELSKLLRYSAENIIFHSSWTGSNPDFNIYLEKYNTQIDFILESELTSKQGGKCPKEVQK